ncbi:hypothetical protein GDO81_012397 [Engystomops pustulosus]|uniref:Uncharacterized protein n=1 Tax=Engystomops pustulosus TaxID=76066 RepID=A0AAV7BLB4_ENGPU|nr:hypothetical protein GDO81_012397 [Engystomops pustulosus]
MPREDVEQPLSALSYCALSPNVNHKFLYILRRTFTMLPAWTSVPETPFPLLFNSLLFSCIFLQFYKKIISKSLVLPRLVYLFMTQMTVLKVKAFKDSFSVF